MKRGLIAATLILGLCVSQSVYSATTYMPNTQKTLGNITGAINADIEAQKKKAQEEAAAKQKARQAEYQKKKAAQEAAYKKKKAEQEAALKKKLAPVTQAQKDYEATKNDLENIRKRYSK